MRNILQDIRFGLRVLSGSPAFSVTAVLTLGLGIASTATVFSWIDVLMLHPYPGASRSQELASLEMVRQDAPNVGYSVSWLDYRDYRDQLKGLSGLAIRRQCAFVLGDVQRPRLTWGELASGNYFEVMGVKPVLGRFFTHEEAGDSLGAYRVTVISSRLWREYFRSDPAIVGKSVRVNRQPLTIVGVAPAEFRGSSPIVAFDLWVPVTMGVSLGLLPESTFSERGDRGMLSTICRRRTGISVAQAGAEAATLAARLEAAYPKSNRRIGATVLSTWDEHNGINELLRWPLQILLGFSLLVLLIVCANVANLLLARSIGRQREFGIRFALGAVRWRVALLVFTETMLLALGGAAVAMLMLLWMQGAILAMTPSVGFPLSAPYSLNGPILAFIALACVLAALISGMSSAMFVFRSNLNEVLKEGSRTDTAGAASRRTRNVLVIAEVTLATIALVGAGLFLRSFRNIRAIHPGFHAESVLFGRFFIETTGYTGDQIQQFCLRLKDRLRAAPGIEDVSYSDFVPLSTTSGPSAVVKVDGYAAAPNESMNVNRALVSPGYFAAMQIPMVDGRDFTDADDQKAAPAIIVNQAFAKRFFRGGSPLGRKVSVYDKPCTVVGLAKDSKYFSPAEAPTPHFYIAFAQFYNSSPEVDFLMRTAGEPELSIPQLRRAVMETDPNASAFHPIPLAEYIEISTFGQKVVANLMGAVGLMCLLLAAMGLYSVMAYTVSRRLPEIGIRMAMGARPNDVIAMIVTQGMKLALVGIAVGTVAALAVTRMVGTLLVGVGTADLASFAGAAVFLCLVTLGATWLPAFRATRIDPLLSLRK